MIVDWDVVFKPASWFHIAGITPALSRPAADLATPRRKPRGKDKHRDRGRDNPRPPEDIAYNRAFARRQIIVEHRIGRLRHFA